MALSYPDQAAPDIGHACMLCSREKSKGVGHSEQGSCGTWRTARWASVVWRTPSGPKAVSGRGSPVYIPPSSWREVALMAPSFARSGDIRWPEIPLEAIRGRWPFPLLQHWKLSLNIRTNFSSHGSSTLRSTAATHRQGPTTDTLNIRVLPIVGCLHAIPCGSRPAQEDGLSPAGPRMLRV